MINPKTILLKKLKNISLRKRSHRDPETFKHLEDLATLGIKVNKAGSITRASQLGGLLQPPNLHQLEILKHFKIKNRSEITRFQAGILIKTIFSDPANIEQWKKRPATSKIKQGVLFMGGNLHSCMTQVEAQSKLRHYTMENPQRFSEWKHIETLYLMVNSRDRLKHYNARKLTWKGFFEVYDDLKNAGVGFRNINADRIHQYGKTTRFTKKPPGESVKTFAA